MELLRLLLHLGHAIITTNAVLTTLTLLIGTYLHSCQRWGRHHSASVDSVPTPEPADIQCIALTFASLSLLALQISDDKSWMNLWKLLFIRNCSWGINRRRSQTISQHDWYSVLTVASWQNSQPLFKDPSHRKYSWMTLFLLIQWLTFIVATSHAIKECTHLFA